MRIRTGTSAAWFAAMGCLASCPGCAAAEPDGSGRRASDVRIESPAGLPRPPFRFSAEDSGFLDEVQRGCFNYLWRAEGPDGPNATGMVSDRSSVDIVSVAGVGFQLAGLAVGVERGWITRAQGQERAIRILRTLLDARTARRHGLFYHYLDGRTGELAEGAYEHVVSTIDSALLLAGVAACGEYFGGEARALATRLAEEADWNAMVLREISKEYERGFISLGWKPDDKRDPLGPGNVLPYAWVDAGDEHRLVTLLAVAAPDAEHRVDPELYYKLRRQVGTHEASGELVYFPWSGALFTSFFAHCFVDYASLGLDDPGALGVGNRPRVDWWENSRRHALLHRAKGAENPRGFRTFGTNAWGLSASDAPGGYAVPGVFPEPVELEGVRAEWDVPSYRPKDDLGDGTLAPYAAGCTILFEPQAALRALRHYRDVASTDLPALWADPAQGGFGFQDAFHVEGKGWVAPDVVAIDAGPLLLAIENARSGLIWRLMDRCQWWGEGLDRVKLGKDRALR